MIDSTWATWALSTGDVAAIRWALDEIEAHRSALADEMPDVGELLGFDKE